MVRFENVGMRYGLGPEVLRDVSFDLQPGSFHFLTGPTGAGKSSLLKLLALSHRPSRGLITLFNKEVSGIPRDDLPAMRRKIGVVFQDFRLLDHLSALENVALPLKIAGAKNDQIYKHVAELLEWVGLGRQVDAKPPTLSGGEKQRVAIARAVINRPQLLIADEPTGSMDWEMGLRLMYLFQELNKIGTTVVVATHDLELIKRFGNPVMYLKDGLLAMRRQNEVPSQFSGEGS
ncbi:MAG: cell division ATP-binding protein FtsE [Sneathiella sp.]|mgnify:FL=1|jgi:cell division transport system ATP-binding protein|uniref:cell division ATP-binding protein FtsE n=1 Tax=Sneathiella sp. TaxID=1964365 RepID=UPI000C5D493A|nr:cell division ATP-binding protein FtsE [Sneathiella sp.]MAL79412.1 cell division ATP-binding protein FtsE [Sneathiella sp.]|tara:strand:- start:343 stop:1041 length:699 start_codon:yes stop_codon:yes gene_type:complete